MPITSDGTILPMQPEFKSKYMMATTAIHKLGDISSSEPDICFVSEETETDYIGAWVYGYGFFGVRFSKETTRELTPEEIEKYEGSRRAIGSTEIAPIKIKETE